MLGCLGGVGINMADSVVLCAIFFLFYMTCCAGRDTSLLRKTKQCLNAHALWSRPVPLTGKGLYITTK
jgi:hypothetical protein